MTHLHRQTGQIFAIVALLPPVPALPQQVVDSTFRPIVAPSAYPEGKQPVVLIDGAHHNFHTAEGRYLPFAELLRRDGYVVMGSTEPFTAEALDGADLLVISNAIAESTLESWTLPTPSAFGDDEIDAVEAWVRGGGALLLIDDALSEARTAARLDPLDPYYKHHVGKLLFCDGRETEAIRHLQRSMRWDRALPIARRTLVDAWARQGQPDSALEALLRAVEERDPQVLFHRCDSAFDVLVEDPRLAEVARRIGLP